MTLIASKIQNTSTYQAKYTLDGTCKFSGCKKEEADRRLPVARELRNYFEEGINRFPDIKKGDFKVGVGPGTALLEIGVALGLAFKTPSAATVVNALTSGAEFVETLIGGTHVLETDDEKKIRFQMESESDTGKQEEFRKKLEELKSNKGQELWTLKGKGSEQQAEMIISGVQLGAGVVGGVQSLLSIGSRFIRGEQLEGKSLSILDKLFFSTASLVNGALMLFSSGEKTLISSLIENRGLEENGEKLQDIFNHGNSIRSNGRSDFRCFMEWIGMSFFTWFKDIKLGNFSVKDIFDVGISSKAIWDGSEYFRDYGKDEITGSKTLMENIFSWNPVMKWYLNSFRERFVSPLISLTGYKSPKISIHGDEVHVEVQNTEQHGILPKQEELSYSAQDPSHSGFSDLPRSRNLAVS